MLNRLFTSAAPAGTAASVKSAAREARMNKSGIFMAVLSGFRPWAAEPFVERDPAETRVAQGHERALLDPGAEVPSLGITYDRTRVASRLQIAGDDVAERGAVGAGDLDDAVARRRERHLGDGGRHVVGRDGLEQAGRDLDHAALGPIRGDGREEFHELGGADDGVGVAGGLDQFLLGDLGAEIAAVG